MKYNLAPKWWSVVIWILAAIVLCGNQCGIYHTFNNGETVTVTLLK
jgi:hypothetical protein